MPTRQYVEISPAKLRPNSNNVRIHSKNQLGQIARSIREFGFTIPIIVDESHTVLAGHARLLAAKQLGISSVPVAILSGLSEARKRAYMLLDNKVAENAGWDRSALAHQLSDLTSLLAEEGLDIGLTGFEAPEIDRLLGDLVDPEHDPADDFPQPQSAEIAVSQVGDLWTLDRHRVLCGDATESAAVKALMGADRASMVLADVPYNLPVASIHGRGKLRHRDFVRGSGELSPRAFT
jgi:hypothetical protein